MVLDALKRCSTSTVLGPDQLNIYHLRNLPLSLVYLTAHFTLSLRAAAIPAIWKNASVIFIPKAGKPIHQGSSYKPTSLLYPAAKVLVRLLLSSLQRQLPVAVSAIPSTSPSSGRHSAWLPQAALHHLCTSPSGT